jgi:galactokinase
MKMVSGESCIVAERFRATYGAKPYVFRAPGRVNVIGEHTDYNDGFVMPAAIALYTFAAAAARGDGRLSVYSAQLNEQAEFDLAQLNGAAGRHWSHYVRGVAALLQQGGYLPSGANLVIDSQVPIGSGLSSSAALEVSTALALTRVAGVTLPSLELARLCQRAENEFTGARCGIMDQYISCFGKKNNLLRLDCRSLAATHIPLPLSVTLVICNTMVKHELADSEYNKRRASCERAVSIIRRLDPQVHSLRDITLDQLQPYRELVGDVDFRRCRHVITENARVLEAGEALADCNLSRLGELMFLSHESLDQDYEVTCAELNLMVGLARGLEGVYGARMTGGGFGGCTVNLVASDAASIFKGRIISEYQKKTGLAPEVYICSAADGAGAVNE